MALNVAKCLYISAHRPGTRFVRIKNTPVPAQSTKISPHYRSRAFPSQIDMLRWQYRPTRSADRYVGKKPFHRYSCVHARTNAQLLTLYSRFAPEYQAKVGSSFFNSLQYFTLDK
jgi:hypothetical protein